MKPFSENNDINGYLPDDGELMELINTKYNNYNILTKTKN